MLFTEIGSRGWQLAAQPVVSRQQRVKFGPQLVPAPAGLVEIGQPLCWRGQGNGLQKDRLFTACLAHGGVSGGIAHNVLRQSVRNRRSDTDKRIVEKESGL